MSVKKRRSPLITVLLWLCLIAYVLLLLKVILFKFDHDTIVNILNDTDELAGAPARRCTPCAQTALNHQCLRRRRHI